MDKFNKAKIKLDYNIDLRSAIMKQETITRVKLIASKGMILTNGEAYGKEVYLGTGDSPENWHEITEEEYEKIQAEVEEMVV